MTIWYKITMIVSADKVDDVIGVCKGETRSMDCHQMAENEVDLPVEKKKRVRSEAAKMASRNWKPRFDHGAGKIIGDLALQGKEFTGEQAEKLMPEHGYSKKSASSAISKFVKEGLLTVTTPGYRPYKYKISEKGMDRALDKAMNWEANHDPTAH